MTAATITSKGQVTIPIDVRNQLGLQSGDRIEFSFNEATGRYEVYPSTRSLASLKGIVKKPAKSVSIEDMNRAIAEQGASADDRTGYERAGPLLRIGRRGAVEEGDGADGFPICGTTGIRLAGRTG